MTLRYLSLFLFAESILSQYIIDSSSFGHRDALSPSKDHKIPGFQLLSDSHQEVQVLSDRIALTPAYYGNRRGAMWADAGLTQSEWTAELDFRASGPERGGGNLQIWFTREGKNHIATNSIYTVGKFDGLALVVDMYGGSGGSVRGFMNDGNTDYKTHHAVDSLAFGHCSFSYRNLGRPASIKVKQEATNFEVLVDERRCFASDKIKMPSGGYGFGITAASAEVPDSFELYKFIVTTAQGITREEPRRMFDHHEDMAHHGPQQDFHQAQQDFLQQKHHQQQQQQQGDHPSDFPASQLFANQDAQFEDLHNRLQFMSHGIDYVMSSVEALTRQSEGQHQEVARNVMSADRLEAMDARIKSIEQTVKEYQDEFRALHQTLKSSHLSLGESLTASIGDTITTSSPRMGFLIFVFLGFQAALAGSYVVYKRRKANGPKKYL